MIQMYHCNIHSHDSLYFYFIDRFGNGPYKIEVCVLLEGIKKYFTIQTAPNDIAPHAILKFMEMINTKSWDDTLFYHQADHVVMGVPINIKAERKKTPALKPLLFSEHNEKYPHEKLTIGFSDGGPNFYINIEDNTKIHGPGGGDDDDHGIMNQGESCFGRIIHGQDIVKDFITLNKKAVTAGTVQYTRILNMKRIMT